MTFEEALARARALNPKLTEAGVRFAVTGGVAVLLHLPAELRTRYGRRLYDLDYNIHGEDFEKFKKAILAVSGAESISVEDVWGQFAIDDVTVEYHLASNRLTPTTDIQGVTVLDRQALLSEKKKSGREDLQDLIDIALLQEGRITKKTAEMLKEYHIPPARRASTDSNESKGKAKVALGVMDAALDYAGQENDDYESDEELAGTGGWGSDGDD